MNSELKRVNRVLTCGVTGREVTVKPDKYQKLVEYHGSEEKVNKNFISYTVEKEARSPSFLFWFENCSEMKTFRKKIRKVMIEFKNSKRLPPDVQKLQNDAFSVCGECGINKNLIEFVTMTDEKGGYAAAIIIKNIPFINRYKIEIE